MRKALGILVLALIVGTSASAENNSVIKYTLQVGGNNAGGPGVPFDTTNVREAGELPLYHMDWDVLTWSAKVEVSGEIDGTYVAGAANLVWDLTLRGPDGLPVGTGWPAPFGFGLGSPTTAGFFSSIMNVDGGGDYATQPACFAWVFGDGVPFGRLIDPVDFNGSNMAQFTYPSTYHYYRHPGAAFPVDPAIVGAPTGTLMGMGAGYTNLDPDDGSERTGVGILNDGGGLYSCFMDIGAKTPIAEGQINMSGLPNGIYTLELTPGDGNNVVYPNGFQCGKGTVGAFAARAGTVTGSTIQFRRGGGDPLWLTVNLAPAAAVTAGCTWNLDGDAAQRSGVVIPVFNSGTHVVSFQAAPGWSAPPKLNVSIVFGSPTTVGPDASTTFVPSLPHDGDMNGDGHVDHDDVTAFRACFSGPAVAYSGDCAKVDFDNDGDVDQSDFGKFEHCCAGSEQPPACAP